MNFGFNPDSSDLVLEDSIKMSSLDKYVVLGVIIDNRLTFTTTSKIFVKNSKQTKRTDKNCFISES